MATKETQRPLSRGMAMRNVALVLLFVLLTGCASTDIGQANHRDWSRDSATEPDLARDQRDCKQQAVRETPAGEPTVATAAAEARRFVECMRAKGWR
jgi:hypothetical protein